MFRNDLTFKSGTDKLFCDSLSSRYIIGYFKLKAIVGFKLCKTAVYDYWKTDINHTCFLEKQTIKSLIDFKYKPEISKLHFDTCNPTK